MGRTRVDQNTQVWASGTYDDTVTPAEAAFETNPVHLETDLNNLRSLALYLKNRQQTGNWFDSLKTPTAFTGEGEGPRGIDDLNDDLHALERKRVLVQSVSLADVSVGAASAATETLTLAGNPADTETVTIGSQTYTFNTVLGGANSILIGASASDSLDNLIAAINNDTGEGTTYGTGTTENADVTAAAGAGDTMDVTAKKQGTFSNTIATTETLATAGSQWGGATLSGGAGGDVIILGSGELPSNTTAAVGAVTTQGTVVAADTGTFGEASLAEIAGSTGISPKNFVNVVDADNRDPILDGEDRIYGLLQGESGLVDGDTITDTTDNRVQVTFVKISAEGNDLQTIDGSALSGVDVNLAFTERKALFDLNEQDFLNGAIVDVPGAATVSRQVAYNNQGATPVDSTTNSTLDLEGAGLYWEIRDDLQARLIAIIEGSAGSSSEIEIGSDVDIFDIDALDVDFDQGISVATGKTRPIDIGENDGIIESTAGDLEVQAASELILSDGNESAGWSRNGILLSDTSDEWDDFESEYGEVSLLNAIVQAKHETEKVSTWAHVTSAIGAGTLITGAGGSPNISAQMPSYKGITFTSDVDIYVNGIKMRPGADAAANNDVYPSAIVAEQAQGAFYAEFDLSHRPTKDPDNINMVVWGQPDP